MRKATQGEIPVPKSVSQRLRAEGFAEPGGEPAAAATAATTTRTTATRAPDPTETEATHMTRDRSQRRRRIRDTLERLGRGVTF